MRHCLLCRCVSNCADFDLCERCQGLEHGHDDDHILLKIRRPLFSAGRHRDGKCRPLLARNLYKYEQRNLRL